MGTCDCANLYCSKAYMIPQPCSSGNWRNSYQLRMPLRAFIALKMILNKANKYNMKALQAVLSLLRLRINVKQLYGNQLINFSNFIIFLNWIYQVLYINFLVQT